MKTDAEHKLNECEELNEHLRDKIKKLEEELESHAWEITPAMAQAKIDELNAKIENIEAIILEEYKRWKVENSDISMGAIAACSNILRKLSIQASHHNQVDGETSSSPKPDSNADQG